MKIFEMKVKKCKKLYRRRKKLLMSVDFDLSIFPILVRFIIQIKEENHLIIVKLIYHLKS